MHFLISNLRLPLSYGGNELKKAAAGKAGLKPEQIRSLRLVRRSLDARKKEEIHYQAQVEITCDEGVYYVEGTWLERLIQSTNFSDYESRMFFDKALREAGVFDKLEEMGIKEGDTVDVEGYQFDYVV